MNLVVRAVFVLAAFVATIAPMLTGAADAGPLQARHGDATVNARIIPLPLVASVRALRHLTTLPIIVPSAIDLSKTVEHRVYVETETPTADSYVIYVGVGPNCGGRHVCGWFGLSAKVARASDALRYRKRVTLGRGVDGDFTPSDYYAYPTDTQIRWRLGSTAYDLSTKGTPADSVSLARSIVANLVVVTRPSRLTTAPPRAPLAARLVPSSLQPGIAELRRVSGLPVFVPAALPAAWGGAQLCINSGVTSFSDDLSGEASYAYFIGTGSSCGDHYYADVGLFVDRGHLDPLGQATELARGISARTERSGYWDRALGWKMDRYSCVLGTSNPRVSRAMLIALARSIVTNRP